MIAGAIVVAIIAVLVYIVHHLRVSMIRDYKGKYDYINAEIKTTSLYLYASASLPC